MYKIIGTNKIKSSLTLNSVGDSITSGQTRVINDEQFNGSEIQHAHRDGYIEFVQMPSKGQENQFFTCINIHTNAVSIPGRNEDIQPGKEFALTPQEYYGPYVQDAIRGGVIAPKEKPAINRKIKEGVVDAGRFMEEAGIKGSKKTNKSPIKINNNEITELKVAENSIPVKASSEKKTLVKKQSKKKTSVQKVEKMIVDKIEEAKSNVTITQMKPKPKSNPKKKFMTANLIDDENPKAVDPSIDDPQGCVVAWTPGKSGNRITDLREPTNNDLNFVDREQEQEKIAKHPKLNKEGNPDKTGELDFVDY